MPTCAILLALCLFVAIHCLILMPFSFAMISFFAVAVCRKFHYFHTLESIVTEGKYCSVLFSNAIIYLYLEQFPRIYLERKN